TAEKSLVCLATTPLTNSRDDLCEKCGLAIAVGQSLARAWDRLGYDERAVCLCCSRDTIKTGRSPHLSRQFQCVLAAEGKI
ncbi:MAG: hypothetical protein KDA60_12350, partial [Planctomycetales bacterium]|nr:hypothetical protein [Planctomycetales bacterium]